MTNLYQSVIMMIIMLGQHHRYGKVNSEVLPEVVLSTEDKSLPESRSLVELNIDGYLHAVRSNIIATLKYHDAAKNYSALSHELNVDLFLNGYWQQFMSNPTIPVMVILVDFAMKQFGNVFGAYLTHVSCGEIAGAHEIVIDLKPRDIRVENGPTAVSDLFFETSRPPIFVHPNPATSMQEATIINYKNSGCMTYKKNKPYYHPFPWLSYFPVDKMIPSFRRIVLPAMDAVITRLMTLNDIRTVMLLPQRMKTHIIENRPKLHEMIDTPNLRTILTSSEKRNLPIWPDVSIHFRCSDNLFWDRMGLTPFRYILSAIPNDAKYIFIATESTKDANMFHICSPVLQELVKLIQQQVPLARVVVRAGGNEAALFIVLAQLIYSPVAICSASTFCFHVAAARNQGTLFIPNAKGVFYSQEINCCDTIRTMVGSYTISKWVLPDAMKIDKTNANKFSGDHFVNILHNVSYPFYSWT